MLTTTTEKLVEEKISYGRWKKIYIKKKIDLRKKEENIHINTEFPSFGRQ